MSHEITSQVAAPGIPKLLLIDDDLTAGPLIKAALKGNFEVAVERSGANAVIHASAVGPQVILLDLHMPNIDGFEVLQQIRQHPALASVPIICASGDITDESRQRAYKLGAIGCLSKPLNPSTLARDLAALLTSLNVEMTSPSKKLSFTIAFSSGEKRRMMRREILSSIGNGKKAIVVSLRPGADFTDPELDQQIREGTLQYLQISPSLVMKIPFLEDLSPVTDDLKSFLPKDQVPARDSHLLFEDPQLVIGSNDPQQAVVRVHRLKNALADEFETVSFFSSRDVAVGPATVLNEMAVMVCR